MILYDTLTFKQNKKFKDFIFEKNVNYKYLGFSILFWKQGMQC